MVSRSAPARRGSAGETAPPALKGNELQQYVIDSMIQGVTQQSAWTRRDTQAEAQFDCVNSPVNGAESRMGFDEVAKITGQDQTNAFIYEIFRGDTEHYLVVISDTPQEDGKRLHVYDVDTGEAATVTYTATEDYLACANPPNVSLVATTIDDTTFIANREKNTAMDTVNKSPAARNEAIVFFKAGGYLITFQVAVTYNGKVYTWSYTTPDNSTVANAPYINTNQMAAAFFRSFTGVDAVVTTSGDTVVGSPAVGVSSISLANPAVVTTGAPHGLSAGDAFSFETTGTLPAHIIEGQTYYALASGLTSTAFTFSLAPSGTAVDTGADSAGTGTISILPGTPAGVGGASTGDIGSASGASQSGSTTLTSLGFYVKLNGNCILIGRNDNAAWSIDTGDGVGDTYLHCAKDTIQNFDDLPASCFAGFTTKVIGSNANIDDDYFVQFQGPDGSAGYWKEVVAPGTTINFDATTMPHLLVNTGTDTFEWKEAPWQPRVAGDGINNSLDPSFVGNPIQDLSLDHGRLGLMWEGGTVWSRSNRSNFTFFPDSAQTVLDTDPIDIVPGGGKTIALLRRFVQIAESTFLWAQKVQFRATSGVNAFTQANVEMLPSTNFEFSPLAIPKPVGQSLYFVTETGAWATLRDLATNQGLPSGATDVTGHVKKYIPSGVRWVTASDTLGLLFLSTIGAYSQLYCYNYLLSATARLQSSWNTWRLPANSKIIWAGMTLQYLYVLVVRPDGLHLMRNDLTVDLVDAEAGSTYRTRADMRVTEAQCTLSYDADTDKTTITAPYDVSEAVSFTGTCPLVIVNRDSSGTRKRGHSWTIDSVPDATHVVVNGDIRGDHWYFGWRVRSEREESQLYLKTTRGIIPADAIQVKDLVVNFDNSTYFRAEVTYQGDSAVRQYPMPGQLSGDNKVPIGVVPVTRGSFTIPIDSASDRYTVNLVNDSPFPSRWISCVYNFKSAFRAMPSQYGQSIPSYFAQGGQAGYSNNF